MVQCFGWTAASEGAAKKALMKRFIGGRNASERSESGRPMPGLHEYGRIGAVVLPLEAEQFVGIARVPQKGLEMSLRVYGLMVATKQSSRRVR